MENQPETEVNESAKTADPTVEVSSEADAPEAAHPAESADKTGAATSETPTDKALDFAFGVGLLTAESLSWLGDQLTEASKQMQDQAPDFIREMQEKGRPTRERILGDMTGSLFTPLKTPPSTTPAANESVTPFVPPVTPSTPTGKSDMPAEVEIQRLEDRVRELEQQLTPSPSVPVLETKPESEEAVDGQNI